MITTKELLTTYWSQLTLIVLGLGYLIKRALDLRTKKLEINHSLFQQKRLESVNNFFTSYARTEQMWIDLAIYDILNGRLEAKEIDDIIYPHINELKRNLLELQIYFEENDHKHFAQILADTKAINSALKKIYFDVNSNATVTDKSNVFQFAKDEKTAQNEKIFRNLSVLIRKTFH